MKKNSIYQFVIVIMILFSFGSVGQIDAQNIKPKDVVILYDNDVHCAIDGYARMAGERDVMKNLTPNVALVSCGDFVSGNVFGSINRGEYIVELMNVVGYDFITLGNHEFDYRIPQLQKLTEKLTAKTLSCNFRTIDGNKTMFDGHAIKQFGKLNVAFIGVSTPESMTSSTPAYFKDENGKFVYTFCQDRLFEIVQNEVDQARQEGADYVVVLSHLGDVGSAPTSLQLISHTSGIDVVLDGHAHSEIPQQTVLNSKGKKVVLSSTGTAFANVGRLIIKSNGHISTELIPTDEIFYNSKVSFWAASVKNKVDEAGRREIGSSAVAQSINDETGARIVRKLECNLGDFCADAYRMTQNTDIGWCNGGSIRADLPAGKITLNSLLSVFPFNSQAAVGEVTGQAVLDALEMTSRRSPVDNGGFAQVSGLKYEIDTTVASSVIVDGNGVFSSVNGKRRVHHVTVLNKNTGEYEPIVPTAHYTIAASAYVLRDNGDGVVFPNIVITKDAVCSDAEILETYITKFLNKKIGTEYAEPQGRIIVGDGRK